MLTYTLTPFADGERGETPGLMVRAHATKRDAQKHVRENDGAKIISEKEARRLCGAEIDWLFAGQGVSV